MYNSSVKKLQFIFPIMLLMTLISCGGNSNEKDDSYSKENTNSEATIDAEEDPMSNKGVGPIKNITLEETINKEMAKEGEKIFEQYCTACHKVEDRYIGPPVKEVTKRRSPEWIMNMILNPEEMIKKDPIAKQLLEEYMAPMVNQNLSEEQARKLLEYFRSLSKTEPAS